MRTKSKGIALTLTLSLFAAGSANAELVSSDWLSEGDNLVTLDTSTGIEWLDLTQTKGMSARQVLSDSRFEGWRLATFEELIPLFQNYLPDVDYTYVNTSYRLGAWPHYENKTQITQIREMLNLFVGNSTKMNTGQNQYDYEVIYGMGLKENGSIGITGGIMTGFDGYYTYNDARFYGVEGASGGDFDYQNGVYAPYLVSDGGVTLSSIKDPSINQANPNAPINASAPLMGAFGGLLLIGVGMRSQRRTKV